MCSSADPGDPEDFLYAGRRTPTGLETAIRSSAIRKLIEHGGNCIYLQVVRTHGGDAGPDRTQNPFVDSDPARGLDEDILDQWEEWFTLMDRNGILIYLFFYDDGSRIWDTGDRVGPEERAFVEAIVAKFKHHENLIWVVGEESEERYRTERVQAIAEVIRRADERGHLIGDHHHSGTTFKAWQPGGAIDHFSMQLNKTGDEAHAGAVEALQKAAGRYQVIFSESTAMRTDPDGMRHHAWAVAMGGVMPMLLRMDIAATPVEILHQCRFLQEFFEATDFYALSPHDELKHDGTRYVLADPGRSYIAYADDLSGKMGIRNLGAGEFAVTWMDCRTGRTVDRIPETSGDGDQSFDKPPEIGRECVAWIRARVPRAVVSGRTPRSGGGTRASESRTPGRPSNDAPVVNDTRITSPAGTPSSIQLSLEDDDGPGPYTFTLVRGPEHGTLTGDNNDRTYTPNAGFVGTDRFRWKVNDGIADSRVATVSITVASREASAGVAADYFPPPESQGGWRRLEDPREIRRVAGMDPAKLRELDRWLRDSDRRNFAAVVIRRGHIVLEVERGNDAKTDARRVASVSKAVCATVLAIASDLSQQGKTPRRMTFDDPAFQFIPWAEPLSDPRKSKITVKQLFNHTSGLCPEATGARNEGTWEYILGHTGDERTAKLAFDPGTACGYSTHALHHAALVCETVTGKPYDEFAVEALFQPLGIGRWTFLHFDGDAKHGRHASHSLGLPARELARIGYCMLREGRWGDRQVVPRWFVAETAAPTHGVTGPELRFMINAQVFSHGWELPARLDGERGRGLPADARYKPGSGGQLVAFVPSLDLVIARQTGGSGEWAYDEFLRRACAAVVPTVAAATVPAGRQSGEDVKPPSEPVARPATPKRFDWEVATPESQGISGRKLDALKESLAARNTRALLVIRDDKIVSEWYAPGHSASTRQGTASLAKAIVGGVSLAVAMDDGRIALDDPAARFIPQWKEDPRKSRITIRQLGSHTSGLADAEAEGKKHDELTGWKGDFWKRMDPAERSLHDFPRIDPRALRTRYQPAIQQPGHRHDVLRRHRGLRDAPVKDIRTLLRDRIMRPIGVPDEEWACGYGKTFTVRRAAAGRLVGRRQLHGARGGPHRPAHAPPGRLGGGADSSVAEAVRQTTGSSGLPGPAAWGGGPTPRGDAPSSPRMRSGARGPGGRSCWWCRA